VAAQEIPAGAGGQQQRYGRPQPETPSCGVIRSGEVPKGIRGDRRGGRFHAQLDRHKRFRQLRGQHAALDDGTDHATRERAGPIDRLAVRADDEQGREGMLLFDAGGLRARVMSCGRIDDQEPRREAPGLDLVGGVYRAAPIAIPEQRAELQQQPVVAREQVQVLAPPGRRHSRLIATVLTGFAAGLSLDWHRVRSPDSLF
jgi:hypothetical protein